METLYSKKDRSWGSLYVALIVLTIVTLAIMLGW